jgi:glycosyltransferase involved in cell wall biosynthesis
MKILWLSHLIPYPPKGGVLQRSYHLLNQLTKYHDVDLLAFNQKELIGPLFNSVEEGEQEALKHLSAICNKVEFFEIPCDKSPINKKLLAFKSLFTRFPYTLNWLLSEQFSARLKELIYKEKYDFIHFDTISLAPYLSSCNSIPTSLDHHNIESHMLFRRASKETNIVKKLYFFQEGKRLEKYERIYCPKFSFNFTCSDVDTKRLLEISPTSFAHTIPNGVDTTYFTPEPPLEKKNSLLFIGTLNWYPNIEAVEFIAQKIWPQIKRDIPETQVDIIGANPPDSIKRVAQNDKNFYAHGFVDDILPYFKQAKCYVCPIKDGGGTKLKILDALSMGMAIVADPIACEGIDVTDRKDVVFAETPAQYMAAITEILQDQKLRETLQLNARKLAVKMYSFDNIGKELSSLFQKYQIKSDKT